MLKNKKKIFKKKKKVIKKVKKTTKKKLVPKKKTKKKVVIKAKKKALPLKPPPAPVRTKLTDVTPVGTVNAPVAELPRAGLVPAVDVSASVTVVVVNPAENDDDCPSGCVEFM